MPIEVEFESSCINDDNISNYVKNLFAREVVVTHQYFGWDNPQHLPKFQRVGGFDTGYWIDDKENEFLRCLNDKFLKNTNKKHEKHDLYPNEGDVALAVRSVCNIVLTNDQKVSTKGKKGPLKNAFNSGYRVVFLNDYDTGISLNQYVKDSLEIRNLLSW